MREKSQELDELVGERAEDWRPHRYGWSTNDSAPESQMPTLDRIITICVTKGRSVRTAHRLTKPRASIGSVGGRADMQIDDPEASPLHCAVAITENGVRLYDLDSENGTYVDDSRIQVADLEDLFAFRIGSTEFVVSIVPVPELPRIVGGDK
jgi:pSer/pThr/pTyr-binding forkhead associated (FHA) protein